MFIHATYKIKESFWINGEINKINLINNDYKSNDIWAVLNSKRLWTRQSSNKKFDTITFSTRTEIAGDLLLM